ncbi:MAG: type II secretion system secretin GspD [Nitrospiria bacterium]
MNKSGKSESKFHTYLKILLTVFFVGAGPMGSVFAEDSPSNAPDKKSPPFIPPIQHEGIGPRNFNPPSFAPGTPVQSSQPVPGLSSTTSFVTSSSASPTALPVVPNPAQEEYRRESQPQRPRAESGGTAVLNFSDASLKDILRTVGDITGENFIIAPGVTAKISVQTTKPVPKKDVFAIFESILEVNGLAMVKAGSYFEIVPGPSVKQRNTEIYSRKDSDKIPQEDLPINVILPVDFISANDLTQVLKPMLSSAGNIAEIPKSNTLIITDVGSNIKKILEVVGQIDVDIFKKMNITVIPVINTDVKTIHKELSDILTVLGFGKETNQLAIVPIERLNTLILFSTTSELLNSVKEWIDRLDRTTSSESASIHFYNVQNDKASTLKAILEQIYMGKRSTAPATPSLAPTSRQSDNRGSNSAPVSPPVQTLPPFSPSGSQRSDAVGSEDIKIFLYEPSNALIIQASQRDYQSVLNTLRELDRPPKQVLIDALIVEVSLDQSTQFGIQWSGVARNASIQQNTGIVSTTIAAPGAPLTTPVGVATPSGLVAFAAADSQKFFGLVQALASEGRVNVLSNPHITVKNYEKASINIGSDEPIATQSAQTAVTGTTGIIQNIEYRKTGVILTVTPQIADGGVVAMTIRQEVSSKSTDRTIGNQTYPSFSNREAETSIVARDRETMVIGGMIQDNRNKSYSGIPFLSQIPLLGYLFRSTSSDIGKTELVILLTPKVISNSEQAASVTDEVEKKMEGLKDLFQDRKFLSK